MMDSISVDSAIAFAETLEYDCLYTSVYGLNYPTMYTARGAGYKTSSEMADMLSQYPHLTYIKATTPFKATNISFADTAEIDTVTAVIPNVTHVDWRHVDLSQTAVDRLVANLPIKWLATPGVIPTDMSSLVFLFLDGSGPGGADSLPIKSRALKYLNLGRSYNTLHGSILENNPNLEVLIAPEAAAVDPLASASLKRLSLDLICHPQALDGLINLEHLEFYRTLVEGVGNEHMSVVHGDVMEILEASRPDTFGLDLAKCPNLRTQYMSSDLFDKFEVENTNIPLLQTLVTTETRWMVNSRLPDLVTLTLDWGDLDMSQALEPLENILATDWAKQIRHLNIRVKMSDCNEDIATRRDKLFGKLFSTMSQLRTFRLVGSYLDFNTIRSEGDAENKMLRELTLEMVKAEHMHLYRIMIDKIFPDLRIMRLPSHVTKHYFDYDICKAIFEVQVPLSDKHKTSASFEKLVQSKKAGYYLPLPNPWHSDNPITKHLWTDLQS